jgi:sn-glycerol 3-phosphate transport system ATP-binding protein
MNLLKNAPGGRPGAILGIRPEHLDVGGSDGWDIRVETVELLGAERLIYGRLGDEQIIVRVEEGGPSPAPDSLVHVRPRPDRLHWFDGGSGKRL